MEMDAIRIKTDANGKRRGQMISTEFESRIDSPNNDRNEKLVYNILSSEVTLLEINSITDGEYSISLFEAVYLAAGAVRPSDPIPSIPSYPMIYRFVGNRTPM